MRRALSLVAAWMTLTLTLSQRHHVAFGMATLLAILLHLSVPWFFSQNKVPIKIKAQTITVDLLSLPALKKQTDAVSALPEQVLHQSSKSVSVESAKELSADRGITHAKMPALQPAKRRPDKQTVTNIDKAKTAVTASSVLPRPHQQLVEPTLSMAVLQQQVAEMGAHIRQDSIYAEQQSVTHVAEVKANKFLASQYLHDWERKVERIGNLNYPEVAAKKDFSGTLTMEVTINPDGSLHAIFITRSSGNRRLDDAALQIVKMSAPFAPLPLALLKELNPKVLGITRVWKFSDESMTTR